MTSVSQFWWTNARTLTFGHASALGCGDRSTPLEEHADRGGSQQEGQDIPLGLLRDEFNDVSAFFCQQCMPVQR